MKKNNFNFIFSLLLVFTVIFSSCATTLNVTVTRPAKLDLNGAETIAVLPFEESKKSPFNYYFDGDKFKFDNYFNYYAEITHVENKIIASLKRNLENKLMESPYIKLVSSSQDFRKTLKYGGDIPADVFIDGEIISLKVTDKQEPVESDDDDEIFEGDEDLSEEEKENKEYTYSREVELIFTYDIVDEKTKNIIYHDKKVINETAEYYNDIKKLPDIYDMISNELDYFVNDLMRNIQPYEERKSITLLEDKSDNPFMNNADKLASDGYYKESYEQFYKLYVETNQYEAGYNASMLLLAMGELENAESLMRNVYDTFGTRDAGEALADIRSELKKAEILENQVGVVN